MRKESDKSWLRDFIAEHAHHVPGAMVTAAEFVRRFLDHLHREGREPHRWTKPRILRSTPAMFPFGRHTGNIRKIGNMAWTSDQPANGIVVKRNKRLWRRNVKRMR
jgi:hypothetical protein